MDPSINSASTALKRLLVVVKSLDVDTFAHRCELLPGGSLGGHVRHCVEFYQCLFHGIESGEVDYDARGRSFNLETCPVSAGQAIQQILSIEWVRLERLPRDLPLRIRESLNGWQMSSLGRELGFAFSHTTHHLALIGVLLRDYGGSVECDFGLAPSTIRHLSNQVAG